MLFKENPFYILHVFSDTPIHKIHNAVEDMILDADNDEQEYKLHEAEDILTNPKKRISAEVSWLCGIEQQECQSVIQRIIDGFGVESKGYAPFSLLVMVKNAIFYGVGEQFILYLVWSDQLYQNSNTKQAMDLINQDRTRAGIPLINDMLWIEEEWHKIPGEIGSAVRQKVTNMLSPSDYTRWMEKTVQAFCDQKSFGEIAEILLTNYQLDKKSEMASLDEKLNRVEQMIRSQQIEPGMKIIREVVPLYSSLLHPILIYESAVGIPIRDQNQKVFLQLRGMGLFLCNSLHDVGHAIEITNLLLQNFSDVSAWNNMLKKDHEILSGIGGNKQRTKILTHAQNNSSGNRTRRIWGIWIGIIACAFLGYLIFGSHGSSSPIVAMKSIGTSNNAENMQFDEPAPGTNRLLTIPQLHWALREKIRIAAIKGMTLNSAGIDGVNQMVSNYNKRVGKSRYRQADMNQAEKDINSIRNQITTQAKIMAGTNNWVGTSSAAPSIPSADSGVTAVNTQGSTAVFRTYHSLISAHRLNEAYQLFSDGFQNAVEYTGWASGYSNTISSVPQDVTILSNTGNRAVLSFRLMAKDRTSNGVSTKFFVGQCTLIKENGEWKIDEITANKI